MRVKGSSPAVRVAAVATAAIAVVYVIGAIVLNLVVAQHMIQQDDDQLSDHLTLARHDPDTLRERVARGDASSDLDTLRRAEARYTGDYLEEHPGERWTAMLREEARARYVLVARTRTKPMEVVEEEEVRDFEAAAV